MAVLKYKSKEGIKTLGLTGYGVSGVSSVNGKTGAVTGVYDADNQPPYPVKSVNGKTGIVTGLYDAENQPPYPVKSVNGLTGEVDGWKMFSSKPFSDMVSSLPSGNTTTFFLDFVFDGVISNGIDGIIFKFDGFPLLWNVRTVSSSRVEVLFHNPGGIPDNPSVSLKDIWMRCFSTGKGVIKSVTRYEY